MHTCLQPSAQVGWAGEEVARVRVPHEFLILRLEKCFSLGELIVEGSEHLHVVASLLRAGDPQVVFLVDPQQGRSSCHSGGYGGQG